jgi:outer membrane murein-binding lipoprotein Lpp
MAGDGRAARWYAQLAMESDAFANAERAAGRTARRGNIVGNAWSYFYEYITGCPGG